LCYCLNKVYFLTNYLDIADAGGTIIIHVFGAYFGLAACAALGKATSNLDQNGSDYTSDRFSLIGTVFLWLFWPSFVAGGVLDVQGQARAITNTVLALLASAVVTFGLTPYFSSKKLAAVPIQNATLAGGVAIGATANLNMKPIGALIIGGFAGAISTLGFCKQDNIIPGHFDTCGINNLHGMPGIFGGLMSAVVPAIVATNGIDVSSGHQLAGLFGTLFFAIVSGGLTGLLMRAFSVGHKFELFSDAAFWDCEEELQS